MHVLAELNVKQFTESEVHIMLNQRCKGVQQGFGVKFVVVQN